MAIDLSKIRAIDVHVHAEVSCHDPEDPVMGQFFDAASAYFKVPRERPKMPEIVDIYRAQQIAFCLFTVDCESGTGAKRISNYEIADFAAQHADICIPFASIDPRKGKGGVTREAYLNQRLRRELRSYVAAHAKSTDPLFASKKGGHFSPNTMCELFLDIYAQCGLTRASSHSGRRSFITRLANKGVNVRLLAALAGHSSIQVTQRYIDVNPDQLSAAVELL